MIWIAVAENHWITRSPQGLPVSVKLWRDGWVLGCRFARQPAVIFQRLRDVVSYLEPGRLV
jgi:hypothetical protein